MSECTGTPEFDLSISWAMCRNPICENFGIHYQGPAPVGRETVSDERYHLDANSGTFRCDYCEMSFKLRSNQAIRPFARYYLKHSLPFADCSSQDCANHGVNAFEHYSPWLSPKERRYSRDDEYMMLCRLCKRRFRIGEALRVPQKRVNKKYLRKHIDGIITQRSVLNTVDLTFVGATTYYHRLPYCLGRRPG